MPGLRTAKHRTEPELPPRQRLLEAVRTGELTPNAAEAEAERLGIGPLLAHPDPADFDPMEQDRWTLPMTIAWIVWRTPEAVREHWDAYVIGCHRWREVYRNGTCVGFEPGPVPRPTWSLLTLNEDYPRERTRIAPWRPRSPHDAREELWKALEQGDVVADAIDLDTRKRVDIPASAWKSLDLYPELEWDIVREDRMSRSGYEDLRFSVRQVVDAWPDRVLSETLPPLMSPEGPGYMPFSAAAQWIATNGGTIDVGHDSAVWGDAYRQLTERIASGDIATTGIVWTETAAVGIRQTLDAAMFGGIRINHLFGAEELDDADSSELYLWATPYIDEEHSRAGFSDDLRRRCRIVWSKLLVSSVDVRKHFPFGSTPAPPRKKGRPPNYLRGPTLEQFRQIASKGEIEPTIAEQARALEAWQIETYPDSKPMAPRYIAQLIHNEYCQHIERQKNE